MERTNPRREYIRHTVGVPLEIRALRGAELRAETSNVSFGGLAFVAERCPEAGEIIELRIPTVEPPFEARARVAWCRREEESYLVGVEFLDSSDAFQARMVQQVCSIERFREEIAAKEGRDLTTQEAAAEWIQKYAGRFPDAEIATHQGDDSDTRDGDAS